MNDTITISNPKYRCPKHGLIENVITSSVEGHKGCWCQICWLESLDTTGVMRCEPMRDSFK